MPPPSELMSLQSALVYTSLGHLATKFKSTHQSCTTGENNKNIDLFPYFIKYNKFIMADGGVGWDEVTYLRKRQPKASQAKSQQVFIM